MNSIYLKIIVESIVFVSGVIGAALEHHPNNGIDRAKFIVSILAIIGAFFSFLVINDVSSPLIDRKADYSAVILSTDEPMNIEYRISTSGDEWLKYKKPIRLKDNAIVYARSRVLWYTSEPVYRDVYVAENGLVYFSGVEKPGDTIVDIKANYNYEDFVINKNAGNHYVGYEIKKNDIKVVGTDLKGNEKEITEFTYSPDILKNGRNDIEVEYSITEDISIKTHLYVNGEKPAMIKIEAKYRGDNIYLDSMLDTSDFDVVGTYEDGTVEQLQEYSISSEEIKEGKNKIVIISGDLSDIVEITAIDRESIMEIEAEPNNCIADANDIETNIKYSGKLDEYDDIDYYRLQIKQKGKLIIKFTHPKIDDDQDFWMASLLAQEDDVRGSVTANGENFETSSSPIRIMPGTYYIKVEAAYSHSEEKYIIAVLFEEEDDSTENEPNDDIIQATEITPDKEYIGNLTNQDDIDYYKFSIDDKRKIWVDFSHDKTNTTNTLWKVSLFDDSDGSLLDFNSIGTTAKITSDSIRIPAGNYYIRIENDYWSDLDYTFCIRSQQEGDDSETEDNGDYDVATKIDVGSSITGNLQSENDVDFYRFDLQDTVSIRVAFTHQRIDNGAVFWRYELYSMEDAYSINNNEDESTIEINGNSPENVISSWNLLPAGTYYLKVYSSYFDNSDYKISLNYL